MVCWNVKIVTELYIRINKDLSKIKRELIPSFFVYTLAVLRRNFAKDKKSPSRMDGGILYVSDRSGGLAGFSSMGLCEQCSLHALCVMCFAHKAQPQN